MNSEIIITCAVTGAGDTADKHPDLPKSPKQIAEAAIGAARAGAAVCHIHVRDPATGAASRDLALFRDTVGRIRDSGVDMILNLTAGMGGDFVMRPGDPLTGGPGTDLAPPEERLAHVEELRPEICTLDCGSVNFGDSVYLNTPSYLRAMAESVRSWGVLPEIEVFEMGHMRLAKQLIAEGLIDEPALFQICLGIPWGAGADTHAMKALHDMLPMNCTWAGFGIGRMQMPMVAQAAILGGNVRVGLEDNLYLDRGVLATNAQLVERAKTIVELLGARTLSPAEARAKLGLKPVG